MLAGLTLGYHSLKYLFTNDININQKVVSRLFFGFFTVEADGGEGVF